MGGFLSHIVLPAIETQALQDKLPTIHWLPERHKRLKQDLFYYRAFETSTFPLPNCCQITRHVSFGAVFT